MIDVVIFYGSQFYICVKFKFDVMLVYEETGEFNIRVICLVLFSYCFR